MWIPGGWYNERPKRKSLFVCYKRNKKFFHLFQYESLQCTVAALEICSFRKPWSPSFTRSSYSSFRFSKNGILVAVVSLGMPDLLLYALR